LLFSTFWSKKFIIKSTLLYTFKKEKIFYQFSVKTLKVHSFKNATVEKQKILQVYKKNSFFKRYECIAQFILPFDVISTEIVDEASFSP